MSIEKTARNAGTIALALLLALTALAWWRIQQRGPGEALEAFTREPKAVMGTTARLIAVRTPGESELAEQALNAAEAELRRIEALMSTWIESSELSRLNAAPAGQAIELSTATLEVIAAAKAAHVETGGAFDATCRPLIELWRQAGKSGVLPSEAELRAARAASTWGDFEIGESAVAKKKASARLDLGGIAKGYAIDRALAVLKAHRCLGGLVEVGGDLACFGDSGSEAGWSVAVRDPFVGGEGKRSAQDGSAAARESGAAASAGELEALWLRPGQAVCTSGDYERYSEIAGERYSHIIDPRTGRPARESAQVSVVAASAMEADVWATALSVLAFETWPELGAGIQALGIRRKNGELERKRWPGGGARHR
jgi:thiamine biosynthesis lipoprotein